MVRTIACAAQPRRAGASQEIGRVACEAASGAATQMRGGANMHFGAKKNPGKIPGRDSQTHAGSTQGDEAQQNVKRNLQLVSDVLSSHRGSHLPGRFGTDIRASSTAPILSR